MPILAWTDATSTERLVHEASFRHGLIAGVLLVERESERQKAITDSLTGLYNRRGFLDSAQDSLQNALPTERFVVLFADLDKFKDINDNHGHDTGDELLKSIGSCLQEAFRGNIVARFGGDEFTILYKIDSSEHAADVIQKVQVSCTESALKVEHVTKDNFGMSIGHSEVHLAHDCNPLKVLTTMLLEADDAMYDIKKDRLSYVRRRP
ncbi:MAG: hypothetical protein JWO41_261 [Candidatus Saccharibacteria bacterium]|nr:hypothetical protein [Candidatus Saccharibacteria bacterium]